MRYPAEDMTNKVSNSSVKKNLRSFVLPEFGISVEAENATEAVEIAKKELKK